MKKFYKVTYWTDDGKKHIALFTAKNAASTFFNEIVWNGFRATFNDTAPISIDI